MATQMTLLESVLDARSPHSPKAPPPKAPASPPPQTSGDEATIGTEAAHDPTTQTSTTPITKQDPVQLATKSKAGGAPPQRSEPYPTNWQQQGGFGQVDGWQGYGAQQWNQMHMAQMAAMRQMMMMMMDSWNGW